MCTVSVLLEMTIGGYNMSILHLVELHGWLMLVLVVLEEGRSGLGNSLSQIRPEIAVLTVYIHIQGQTIVWLHHGAPGGGTQNTRRGRTKYQKPLFET